MRRFLGLVTLMVWLWAPARQASADERSHLWLSLPPAIAPPELDDDLPNLDVILDPSLAEPAPEPEPIAMHARWYGRNLLLADAASVAVLLAGWEAGNDSLFDVGLTGMFVSGTAVHAWHGHWERGALGLLMRWGGAVVGSLAASTIGSSKAVGVAGALTGYLGVVAFDGLYLCQDTVPGEPPAPELGPSLSLAGSGATLGLSGSF